MSYSGNLLLKSEIFERVFQSSPPSQGLPCEYFLGDFLLGFPGNFSGCGLFAEGRELKAAEFPEFWMILSASLLPERLWSFLSISSLFILDGYLFLLSSSSSENNGLFLPFGSSLKGFTVGLSFIKCLQVLMLKLILAQAGKFGKLA